jgi:hypothetical protein
MANVPLEYQLMTAPVWHTLQGDYTVDDEAMLMIASAFAAEGNSLPIYLGHFENEEDENKNPAGGYFDIEIREDGVWAVNVRWREDIAEQIAAGGWRFDSPEFYHTTDDLKRVVQVTADALVHNPASIRKRPITASKAAREDGAKLCHACASKSFVGSTEDGGNQQTTASEHEEVNPMSDAIIKALAVKDEAEALVAITEMKASKVNDSKAIEDAKAKASKAEARADAADNLVASIVEVTECESADKVVGTVTALKEKASKADEASKALAEMKKTADEAEKTRLIESARCSKSTADFLAKQTLDVVKDFCEAHKDAPEVPAGSQSASASSAPPARSEDTAERAEVKKMYLKRGMSDDEAEARTSKHMEARAKLQVKIEDAEPGIMTSAIG